MYRFAARPLYAWPVQIMLLLGALGGALVFIRYLTEGGIEAGGGGSQWIILASIALGLALQLSLHELAHAMTCKFFGREVHNAGAGWLFFLPIIFVDTSDMWMAPRKARALVGFSGPYTNFLLSGLAALTIPFVHDRFVQSLLFEFASAGYVLGLLNMNPLMEFDGYYVLMDLLEVPNLRGKGSLSGKRSLASQENHARQTPEAGFHRLWHSRAVVHGLHSRVDPPRLRTVL